MTAKNKQAKPNRIRKTVRFTVEVAVEFDETIMPDDGSLKMLYPDIKTHDHMAEMLAKECLICGDARLSKIEGFADRGDNEASTSLRQIELEDVRNTRD